ncbi:hypothetical protein BGW42_001624 [Actinomortierella wolfii]|nr:hypothetical protein BGW42_001624 [Actinomortierella wolfii]
MSLFHRDSGYQSLIDHIYKVHARFLAEKLSIPQLAIVGDQSSGKSSTLEAITQLAFPQGDGMCTRFAIMVHLRRDPGLKDDALSARIEGEDGFNMRHRNGVPREMFREVINDASKVLCGDKVHISDKVLEIILAGPTQSPLTIIDLPGFIHTTLDGQSENLPDLIRSISDRYIKEPRTIILAVIPASNDFENSTVLRTAKEYDPNGERTIPIVTKPDLMRNTQQWMNVIHNKSKAMKLGYLVMCNKTYEEDSSWEYARQREAEFFMSNTWNQVDKTRKGRVAVKEFLSRLLYDHISRELPAFKREIRATLDKYRGELETMGEPIADITTARDQLIRANLKLQRQVTRFLNADYDPKYLATYWKNMEAPNGSINIKEEENHEVNGHTSGDEADEEEASGNFDSKSYFVRSSLRRIYEEYRLAMKDALQRVTYPTTEQQVALYKGYELPGFVSFTTFKNVYNGHYLPGWRAVTNKYVAKMHSHLSDAIRNYIRHAADDSTVKVFTRAFSRFSRNQEAKIKTTVDDIFLDEEIPFTMSRHFVEAVHRERSKNGKIPPLPTEQSVIERNEGRTPQPPAHTPAVPPPPPQINNGMSQLSQMAPLSAPSPVQGGGGDFGYGLNRPQENCDWNDVLTTRAMVPCLLAYLTTALDRIVDKVLMETIERHMFRRIDEYFDMLCNVTDSDLDCMLESPTIREQRANLYATIADLEGLLDELS